MDTHPLSGTATVRRTPEPSIGGRGAERADGSEAQGEEAESHAPVPLPLSRAADQAMHVLIAGRRGRGTDAGLVPASAPDGIRSAVRGLLHPEDDDIGWQGIQMRRRAVDWPGDVMLIAADLVAKLTVYPINEQSVGI
jgi:hypothetical protein